MSQARAKWLLVAAALVAVADQDRQTRAGSAALEDAGENLRLVRLLPLGDDFALAGPSSVQLELDLLLAYRNARRAPIHDDAHRAPMRLTPGLDPE